jgi:hypothetical protein
MVVGLNWRQNTVPDQSVWASNPVKLGLDFDLRCCWNEVIYYVAGLSGLNTHTDIVEIVGDSDQPRESTSTLPDVSSAQRQRVNKSVNPISVQTRTRSTRRRVSTTLAETPFATATNRIGR